MISWAEFIQNQTESKTTNDNLRPYWASKGPITPTAVETTSDVKFRALRVGRSLTGTNTDMEYAYLKGLVNPSSPLTLSDLRSRIANT